MKFSRKSLDNLLAVDLRMVRLMSRAIVYSPIDFAIVEGVRSTRRQQELYAQGRTAKGMKVTNVDGVKVRSKHQLGLAVDICPYIDGKLAWDNLEAFVTIAGHIKETAGIMGIEISWGGDWKGSWDKPHFELK